MRRQRVEREGREGGKRDGHTDKETATERARERDRVRETERGWGETDRQQTEKANGKIGTNIALGRRHYTVSAQQNGKQPPPPPQPPPHHKPRLLQSGQARCTYHLPVTLPCRREPFDQSTSSSIAPA